MSPTNPPPAPHPGDPSAPAERPARGRSHRRLGFALALIAVGAVLLLERQGLISRDTLQHWWPLALIAVGVWIALPSGRR